jgi:predicted oxidoreductase (fatty acid repression mutant protein)
MGEIMNNNILELFAKRHSFYDINSNVPLNTNVVDIIKKAMNIYPSSFNYQEARILLLLRNEHKKLWKIIENKLLKATPKEKHKGIKDKILSFSNGFGTILYFIDTNTVNDLEQKYPLYADNFINWACQSNAMLQYIIWTALANNQIGASLQHYNPLIDDEVKKAFHVNDSWLLVAQMPFGGINLTPSPHNTTDLEDKLIILE